MPTHNQLSVSLSYTDPVTSVREIREVANTIEVGRMPNGVGLPIAAGDEAVSRCALIVARTDAGVAIRNTSSFAQVDVRHSHGLRFLFPGETLIVTEDATVLVPGSVHTHRVEVAVSGVILPMVRGIGTRPLQEAPVTIALERLPALAALCAARFYPERFGSALLTAVAISELLELSGQGSTPKAVNNKIQRTRDQLAQIGVFLDSREELADYLIRNGLIHKGDVDRVVSPTKPSA